MLYKVSTAFGSYGMATKPVLKHTYACTYLQKSASEGSHKHFIQVLLDSTVHAHHTCIISPGANRTNLLDSRIPRGVHLTINHHCFLLASATGSSCCPHSLPLASNHCLSEVHVSVAVTACCSNLLTQSRFISVVGMFGGREYQVTAVHLCVCCLHGSQS